MTRTELKDYINEHIADLLIPDKVTASGQSSSHRGYICPRCGSGSGDHGTGITCKVFNGVLRWTCWSGCFAGIDGVELLSIIENTGSDYNATLAAACKRWSIEMTPDVRYTVSEQIEDNSSLPAAPDALSVAYCQHYGIALGQKATETAATVGQQTLAPAEQAAETQAVDYMEFFGVCAARLHECDYLSKRGISAETARRHLLGYCPEWQSPTALRHGHNPPTSPRLIIPTSCNSYLARDTRGKLAIIDAAYESVGVHNHIFPAGDNGKRLNRQVQQIIQSWHKCCKMKEGTLHLYNVDALSAAACIVVEGEIDALSIEDVGGYACALGTVTMSRRLVGYLKQHNHGHILVALDGDKVGRANSRKLVDELRAAGIDATDVTRQLYRQQDKDANDRLKSDRDGLRQAVEMLGAAGCVGLSFTSYPTETETPAEATTSTPEPTTTTAQVIGALEIEDTQTPHTVTTTDEKTAVQSKEIAALHKSGGLAYLADMLADMDRVDRHYIETGDSALDAALSGGLRPALYVLGALPAIGKTTYCHSLAERLAANGHDVLYCSAELTALDMTYRSISRLTAELDAQDHASTNNLRYAMTVDQLQDRQYRQTASRQSLDLMRKAIERYRSYADHLYYCDGLAAADLDKIVIRLNKLRDVLGVNPVVVVDYVQLVAQYTDRARKRDTRAALDNIVIRLKAMSTYRQTPVIAVSSVNRQSYHTAAQLESYKESGLLEYSADVLIALEPPNSGQLCASYGDYVGKTRRELRLRILKNRHGRASSAILYDYVPALHYIYNGRQSVYSE